jgi:hypothetical protein
VTEAMLTKLVEAAEAVEPDWDDALRRAGFLGRHFPRGSGARGSSRKRLRWRRALVLVAVVLAAIFALSALAGGRQRHVVYWLFDRSGETYPSIQVPRLGEWHHEKRAGLRLLTTPHGLEPEIRTVPVLEGELAGHQWELLAFLASDDAASAEELHVGFNPGGRPPPYYGTNVPAFGGGAWGFPMRGLPRHGADELHWVGWSLDVPGPIEPSGGGTGPKYLYGPATADVRHVDLESDHGVVVRVPTFAGPPELGLDVRYWVAVLRLDTLVHTIVPRDAQGKALEHWHLELPE